MTKPEPRKLELLETYENETMGRNGNGPGYVRRLSRRSGARERPAYYHTGS